MDQAILATETGVDATALAQAAGAELVHQQDVAARLSQSADIRAIILVPSLATDLATHNSTQAVLASWAARTGVILELLRQNRRTVLLLDQHDALTEFKQTIVQIQAWIGGHPDPEPLQNSSRSVSVATQVAELAAMGLASSSARIRRLTDEIEAALAPIYRAPEDPVAILQNGIHAELAEAEDNQAKAHSQIESLRTALSFASENYVTAAMDAHDAAEVAEDLRTAVELSSKNYADAVVAAESLEKKAKKADAERKVLLAEITEYKRRASEMTQDIADYKATLADHAATIQDLQKTQEELVEALDATRSSTSWRVTAPIRAVKSALGGAETEIETETETDRERKE